MFQLETNESCLLHEITSITFSDNLAIIFDARGKSVSLFDMEGRFIRKFGKLGKGPDEFLQLTNMHFDSDEKLIEIFDNRRKTLFVYDLKGNLVETKKSIISFISFAKSPEGYYVYSPFIHHPESKGYNLFLLSKKMDRIKERFLPTRNNFDRALYSGNFTSTNSEIFFRHGLNDTIYSLNEGQVSPYFHVDFGSLKVPYDRLVAIKNLQIYDEKVYLKKPSYLGQIEHLLVNDKWIRFTFSKKKFGEKPMLSALYDRDADTIQFYNSYATKVPGISNPYPKYFDNHKAVYIVNPYALREEEEVKIVKNLYDIEIKDNSNPLIVISYE